MILIYLAMLKIGVSMLKIGVRAHFPAKSGSEHIFGCDE